MDIEPCIDTWQCRPLNTEDQHQQMTWVPKIMSNYGNFTFSLKQLGIRCLFTFSRHSETWAATLLKRRCFFHELGKKSQYS
ncbi:hypothetical protein ILYODFUR_032340 [Ilyodon furcidens]|uniref:Uncharacterized protein n=1 Tax=Ilyodon furcidens TaxID=33524 RepID=A0ABV0TE14_9TELE